MKTRVVEGTSGVEEAAALLADGQVVALPTETVYGLAGDALDPVAAARIFEAKERPFFDPLIVHLPSPDWLDRLTSSAANPLVQALVARFWPGPLTIVLPRRERSVPDIVTSGLETVAVRMPAHPLFREVLARFGRPVAAPSANRFGRISPTAASHVLEELGGRIPCVLDGGPCAVGLESTVIAPWEEGIQILRHGPVISEELGQLAEIRAADAAIRSPGQLASHYAPGTPLQMLASRAAAETFHASGKVGLLAWSRATCPPQFAAMEVLTPKGEPREAASRLFAAMRRLDALGLDLILAEPPPEPGLGSAIAERLRKAAAPRE